MGSLPLSFERVSLWATVALHLWGVQVTGLAAKWTGFMVRSRQQVQEGFLGESSRRKQRDPSLSSLSSVSLPCPCGQLGLLPLCRVRAQAPGPLLLGSGILEPHLQKDLYMYINIGYYP